MSEYKYQMIAEFDPAIFPSVKELFTSINSVMADFGFDEKVGAVAKARFLL
jgi:hypothetical protein